MTSNTYQDFEDVLTLAEDRQKSGLNRQKGIAVWLLGLSGSGKTTLAKLLEEQLRKENYFVLALDGDKLRSTVNKDLSFTLKDRAENIRRAAELARLLVEKNVITICSFITPLQAHRDIARSILGEQYFEVYLKCPLSVCEKRDQKGLYKKARNNEIADFTGISSPFEEPAFPWLVLHSETSGPERNSNLLFEAVFPHIQPVI